MQNQNAIASSQTQESSRPNRDLTHVRATSLAFWRAKAECAAYDYKHFPDDWTRRHFYEMLDVYTRLRERLSREHWRKHDPLRWRLAVCELERRNAVKLHNACVDLGIPTSDLAADLGRLHDEANALRREIGMRGNIWDTARRRGEVRRVPAMVKTGRTVIDVDGVRVPVVRRVSP
jgi:hypothetical protein